MFLCLSALSASGHGSWAAVGLEYVLGSVPTQSLLLVSDIGQYGKEATLDPKVT